MTELATQTITGDTRMRDLLVAYPGAQRALFARYHIGGCQSCAFSPDETLTELCARNENIPVDEVIDHIRQSHESDAKILLSPSELHELLTGAEPPRLVDIRTREEFEAVHIEGALLFSQDLLNEIFAGWPKESPIVVYDHTGNRALDAAAFLLGHGYSNVQCLQGGIDAYSRDADTSLPRYKIEIES